MNKPDTDSKTPSEHLPVSIITGFLGSGKTTLLNHLVQHPDMGNVAVLVNEIGEIGLDHFLIETISEEIILLQSGCICCQLNGDFISTLIDLYEKRLAGEVENFTHVLVETTGIADPAPIVQALLLDQQLVSHYRLGNIVTTVDTVFGHAQLSRHQECIRQVSLADKLLLTKSDLSEKPAREALISALRQLNPNAAISELINGRITPGELFDEPSLLANPDSKELAAWLGAETPATPSPGNAVDMTGVHTGGITSFSVTVDGAINWDELVDWLDDLLFSRSRQILRIKGMLNIIGKEGPIVIQAVQHVVYPPLELAKWPTAAHQSALVFITSDLSRAAIETSLRQFFTASRLHVKRGDS